MLKILLSGKFKLIFAFFVLVTCMSFNTVVYGNVAEITGPLTGCAGTRYVFTSNGDQNCKDYQWTVTNGTINSGQGTNEIAATFTQSGTITLKYEDQFGVESNVAVHNISIDQPAVIGIFTVAEDCAGGLLVPTPSTPTVTGGYAGTPFWTLDGVVINIATHHTSESDNGKALRYNVNTGNCGTVSSTPVAIVVKSKPTIVEVTGLPDALCLGSQVNATVKAVHNGTQALTYQWLLNDVEIGNTNNLVYTPVLADHGQTVTLKVSNECGTAITQHTVIISGNQTTPAHPSLAQTVDLPNGYFTRPVDAANTEQMQLPDKYWENQHYLFCTTDNVTYSSEEKIWFNRTSVNGQWTRSTNGVGYEFTVAIVTNNYNSIHSFAKRYNTTILIDEGTYDLTDTWIPSHDNVAIVGYGDKSVKIFGLKNVVLINKSFPLKLVNITGHDNNVVENITLDGDGQTYSNYFLTVREEGIIGFPNDYLIMKDVKVRNAVSKASSNRAVVAFIGMNNRTTKNQKSYVRVHNMTIESSCTTTGNSGYNGAVQVYGTSNVYFKNLNVDFVPGTPMESSLQVTIGSSLTAPSTNLIFDGLTMTSDSILVQRLYNHDLAFASDYRYVRYQIYPNIPALDIMKLFKTLPGYYQPNCIVYDKQDGYWVIPSDASATSRLNTLKYFYSNYRLNNSSLTGAPMPNIKLVADVNGEINGFTVPDLDIDDQVNIVAVRNATDPVSQGSKVVFNSATKISFNAAGANKVNLYNIDFDQQAKYTLPTVQDSISNSKAGNFYNCVFSTYGNGELSKINLANSGFVFANATVCTPEVVDLKDLVLSSGYTAGLELKYYDMSDVELQSTVISKLGTTSYKIVGTHPQGCSYTSTVTVNIIANCNPPKIIHDLEDAIVCIGGSHTWSIEAEGENLSYEWYCGFNRIMGANTNTITISDAKLPDYERYYVVVRSNVNGFNFSVYSKRVKLWVADHLPAYLKFSEYPNPATVGKTYHVKVDGYADVTKYSWSYDKEGVSFSPEIGKETENETWATFGTLSVGTGTLKVTMDHPCGTRELTQSVKVQYPTGIEDILLKGIKVFPNPTTGIVKVLNTAVNQQIKLTDVTGSTKGIYPTQEGTTTIDLTGYAKGTYMLQYNGKTYKVIKQ